MPGNELRIGPVVAPALGISALIAWVLRDHADNLPSESAIRRTLAVAGGAGHHGAGGDYSGPPPVAGDAVAHYAGLAVLALHVLVVVIAAAGFGVRRWSGSTGAAWTGARAPSAFGGRVAFAVAVAILSGLVAATMGLALLGNAISPTSLMAASAAVLQYSFVVVLVLSAALGLP